jgi:sulfoacetaldehyde acetyltransferase
MGSKAAMRVINRADVVLALGSRLGPFGTLPQYGFDYWPKDAKIIQIDANSAATPRRPRSSCWGV